MNEEERFFIRQHPTATLCIIKCRICSVERGYNYDSDDEWHMYSLVEFMEAHQHKDMASPTVKQASFGRQIGSIYAEPNHIPIYEG